MNPPCVHKEADHQCGTNARARLDGCKCGPCVAAARAYNRKWRRRQGEFPLDPPTTVDAGPVRAHVRTLMRQGMGPKRVAVVAGVATGSLSRLVYGDSGRGSPPSRRVHTTTAEKLLATELNVGDGTPVPAGEAKRILRELLRRGWWKAELGRRVAGPQAWSLQAAQSRTVAAGTLRILRRLLEEPVPLRVHSPTGRLYDPSTGLEWRQIDPSTPGVPPDDAALLVGNGRMVCEVCRTPLVDHPFKACWRAAV